MKWEGDGRGTVSRSTSKSRCYEVLRTLFGPLHTSARAPQRKSFVYERFGMFKCNILTEIFETSEIPIEG